MKTPKKYIPLCIASWLLMSCNGNTTTLDTDITAIVDKTDRMTVYPTSDEITSQLGLKENLWQYIRFTGTCISDKDINDVTILTLAGENKWSGNAPIRKAKVQHFVKQVQQCLKGMKYTGTCPYSIIYRTIVHQANRMAGSNAKQKLLLVYSDLYENSGDLSLYDPAVLKKIDKDPQKIALQMETSAPLKSLNGLQVWLLYSPTSFRQNNTYMAIANIYKQILEAKGATVHIEKTFNL